MGVRLASGKHMEHAMDRLEAQHASLQLAGPPETLSYAQSGVLVSLCAPGTHFTSFMVLRKSNTVAYCSEKIYRKEKKGLW